MPSQINDTAVHYAEYVVPRIVLGTNGRQGNALTGSMRITMGASEPFEFVWSDRDGIPIGLQGLTAKLVFWAADRFESEEFMEHQPSSVVLAKRVVVRDPLEGLGFVLLTGDDTTRLAQEARSKGIRWGLYLLNSSGDVFPCVVSENGNRWGTLHIEAASSMPDMESVRRA